jgi:4-hydroxy-3-polyprenylbenzoate decarboxylase
VESGPVLENILSDDDVDLLQFPAPLWNDQDGGRYIGTGDVVATRDPETGIVNVGTYRVMLHDRHRLGLYISPSHHGTRHLQAYHAQGKPCPIAISFGHHPLLLMVGGSALPYGLCEYNYAGAIMGSPIQVIKGRVTGLPIPADSELAIEGFIYPGETLPEGPFGEYTGYYATGRQEQPVVQVKSVYYRNNPILLGAYNSTPPHDYTLMGAVLKSVMVKDALQRAGVPEVKGVWFHEAAAVNFLLVVAIRQLYPGHSTQAGMLAAQTQVAATGNGRYIIVVDDDVDPTNLEEVVWALCTRSNPETSIDVIRRTYSNKLDPIAPKDIKDWRASRAIIDACRPFARINEFPPVARARPDVRERVLEKWKELYPSSEAHASA